MVFTSPLKKALAALKRSLDQPKNEFTRNSTIQCFEFSYELAWKSLKRYLSENHGVDESNIKNIYRLAAKNGLIDPVENWFEYHKSRNLTSHTYNEETAEIVYIQAAAFYPDAIKLLAKLEA
ncbi:MAG: nucleotidyltransferase substrate binding protein [Oligoflexales bacterium]|nr:nucleotidyltransferase substrate binding protein [Oligoflexales bacterium]